MGGRGSASPASRGGSDEPKAKGAKGKDKDKDKKGQPDQSQDEQAPGSGLAWSGQGASPDQLEQSLSPDPSQSLAQDEKGEGEGEETTANASASANSPPSTSTRPIFTYSYDGPGQGTSTNPTRLNVDEESQPFGVQPVELAKDESEGNSNAGGSGGNENSSQNQWGQRGEPRVGFTSQLPQPPSVSIVKSGGRGKVWKKRLGEAWASTEGQDGQQLEIEDNSFRVIQRSDGIILREVEFYPGFSWEQLEYRMPTGLGLEILQSRGLQRLIVQSQPQTQNQEPESLGSGAGAASTSSGVGNKNETAIPPTDGPNDEKGVSQGLAVTTVLKRLWLNWERGKAKGRFKNVPTFTRYVASNGYRVGMDEGTPLAGAIRGYEALSPREQVVAVLDTTEPRLRNELPQHLRERLDELLDRPGLLARSPMLGQARTPLTSRVNALLAYEVADYREFEAVMRVVEQPASRGSIGEMVFRRFFAGERTASDEMRKPRFEGQWYGSSSASQPDMLRPVSRRTVDVKTGYGENPIDDKQLEKYAKLIQSSRVSLGDCNSGGSQSQQVTAAEVTQANQLALKQKLVDLGISSGQLRGHDLVFLADGSGVSPRVPAQKALELIESKGLRRFVAVYYVEAYPVVATAQSDTQVEGESAGAAIFSLKFDENADEPDIPVVTLVGERLPD